MKLCPHTCEMLEELFQQAGRLGLAASQGMAFYDMLTDFHSLLQEIRRYAAKTESSETFHVERLDGGDVRTPELQAQGSEENVPQPRPQEQAKPHPSQTIATNLARQMVKQGQRPRLTRRSTRRRRR